VGTGRRTKNRARRLFRAKPTSLSLLLRRKNVHRLLKTPRKIGFTTCPRKTGRLSVRADDAFFAG
jgi:hypothetical protein